MTAEKPPYMIKYMSSRPSRVTYNFSASINLRAEYYETIMFIC